MYLTGLSFLLLCTCTYAYDELLSKYMIDLAQATYTVSSVNDWNCLTCNNEIDLEYIVEKSSNLALQGFDKRTNTIFTSFRGSTNIHNWAENIQISKVSPYNDTNISVEKGFYKAYMNVKDDIIDNLYDLSKKYNTHNLLITGHSLGAAMSTIMAYDIASLYPEYKIQYFYNYGSPRVGNTAFVNSFNAYHIKNYRVTHYYDMVPHVPEEFVGYLHISNEIWYNENNSDYIICNDVQSEDDTCSNSCAPIHCTSINDHLYYLNVTMGSD